MAEEVAIDLTLDPGNVPQTLGGLKKEVAELQEEIEKADLGSEKFNMLSANLVKTESQVKNIELGFESLDSEQVAAEIGSIAGAVGDVTSAFVLLGNENETLQGIASSIQKAIGVSLAFKGAIEGVLSVRKLLNRSERAGLIISKARAVVTKVATALQWLWNAAITANPIGIIVVAIGLLIAGIVLLITHFKDVISFLGSFLGLSESIEDQQKKAAEARKKRAKQQFEEGKRRLKQLKEIGDLQKKLSATRLTQLDLEIEREDILGRDTTELTKKRLQEAKNIARAELDLSLTVASEQRKQFKRETARIGFLSEARKKEREAFIKSTKDDFDIANNAFKASQNQLLAFIKDQEQIRKDASKKRREKRKADEEKRLQEIIEANNKLAQEEEELILAIEELENAHLDKVLTDQQIEENAVRDKFFNILAAAEQNGIDTALLEQAQFSELNEIRNRFDEEDIERQKEKAELEDQLAEEQRMKVEQARLDEIDKQKAVSDQAIEGATALVSSIEQIRAFGNKQEIDRINARIAAGEKISNAEKRKLENDIKVQKSFAVAKLAIDTASGISSAIAGAAASAAALGPGAVVATPIFIATQIAAVLAAFGSAAAILSAPTPNFSQSGQAAGTGNAPDQADDLTAGAPNTGQFSSGSTIIIPPSKVVVLESEITDVQATVVEVQEQATFG